MEVNLNRLKNTMMALMHKNDIVANNLSNINTTGYKREKTFLNELEDAAGAELKLVTNFEQGQIKQTNNPLDMAIVEKGYFVIKTENGNAFTRDGHFSLGTDGILKSSGGNPVMGEGGEIYLSMDGAKMGSVTVSRSGDIYLNEEYIDTLQIVDFKSNSNIDKIGDNLFQANNYARPFPIENPDVLQGNLESSNVIAVHEMVNMIDLQRNFESSQRTIKTIDGILGKAANDISRYS